MAGYDRRTPFQVEFEAPGKFASRETREGDGRVPHALGLLEAVKTYWVDEEHGALPKNDEVLDAISDLLQRGETSVLATERPASRRTARSPARTPRGRARAGRGRAPPRQGEAATTRTGRPTLTPEEEVRLENLVATSTSGSGERGEPAVASTDKPRRVRGWTKRPSIAVEIAWGDVTQIEADVYAVGHYQGVLPRRELALDCVVSGIPEGCDPVRSRLVITRHTRRGVIRGALGDVDYFPWSGPQDRGRRWPSPAWDAPARSTNGR